MADLVRKHWEGKGKYDKGSQARNQSFDGLFSVFEDERYNTQAISRGTQ